MVVVCRLCRQPTGRPALAAIQAGIFLFFSVPLFCVFIRYYFIAIIYVSHFVDNEYASKKSTMTATCTMYWGGLAWCC